jgi:hypothetical protein
MIICVHHIIIGTRPRIHEKTNVDTAIQEVGLSQQSVFLFPDYQVGPKIFQNFSKINLRLEIICIYDIKLCDILWNTY